MFTDARCEPVAYLDPWCASYEERLRALGRRSRHVAYVYERPESSSFRYRVFNMIEALEAAPALGISASWFTQKDLRGDLAFVDRADAIIICRTRYDHDLARLVAKARARGTRLIFDIDDLVFDPEYVHVVTHTLDMTQPSDDEWNYWFGYVSRIGAAMRCCDSVITTTAPLAERVRDYAPDRSVTVLPNFLNRRQCELSQRLLGRKREGGYRREEPTMVGYFSGSPTHNRDLLVASPGLAQILKRHLDVALRVVGYIQLNDLLEPFRHRIQVMGMQDFVNLQRTIAEVEVNIVPLQNNVFTNCKSELKYFEAGAVGVPTVASPTAPLAGVITHGVNGFLSRTHEWEGRIAEALDMLQADPTVYEGMADRAAEDSLSRFGWNRQARRIEAAVFGPT